MSELNLRADDLDSLGKTLITIAKELWVTKDRQKILEAALAEAGVMAPDAVDRYQPDDELDGRLKSERAEFIEQVLGALSK
ncbi:MAG: hypothetical protein QF483_02670 [Gammaproteobacteria bacterium]|jgi:hypothetical protein|nr:hypothetical protein [Chromatiales bacterium]MDP6149788.1 hypothetical protein [Gammaproteobacteria bacterium]MDP7094385.1 hypothetical protein [Gammaproteobacteria bacterium]MDP7418766.1 hypothetical protein [Gammaproteobacteria bacterium]HJP04110.1 hypothetical protein [Gammaproteobacteria bacterium]